jgi:DNA-binding response OmpR family regulator
VSEIILIVDDDPDTLEMLDTFVRSAGYEVKLAADGRSALAMMADSTPDLILLDAVMPDLDGFETCRRIKAGAAAAIPVIFMTGLTDTEHVVQGLEAGGIDYVTKPISFDELGARMKVHLDSARQQRSAIKGLTSVGARLFSCDDSGRITWRTPDAGRVLDALTEEDLKAIRERIAELLSGTSSGKFAFGSGTGRFTLTRLGDAGSDEHLFKMVRSSEGVETQILQEAFGLTGLSVILCARSVSFIRG